MKLTSDTNIKSNQNFNNIYILTLTLILNGYIHMYIYSVSNLDGDTTYNLFPQWIILVDITRYLKKSSNKINIYFAIYLERACQRQHYDYWYLITPQYMLRIRQSLPPKEGVIAYRCQHSLPSQPSFALFSVHLPSFMNY